MAGVSLPRARFRAEALRRGGEREATLLLVGPSGEEAYDVTVRLAARRPRHVEFAFVRLPPPVRRVLLEVGPIRPLEAPPRRATAEAPLPRRLMLHLSEAVAEVTRSRRPDRPDAASITSSLRAADGGTVSVALLLVLAAALVSLAAGLGWLLS